MWNILVCDGDSTEREQIMEYVRLFCTQENLPVYVKGCACFQAAAELLKAEKNDVFVVAQDGVEGMDTITCAGSLAGQVIWFSDLDFGVQSYRLCVSYFGRKPVSPIKVRRALERCAGKGMQGETPTNTPAHSV